jgi:RHS repeat-associated protein
VPTGSYAATYDAWNRLVKLVDGGSTAAIYQYDGLKRRSVKQTYTGGVLSETRHYFYSSNWQVVEERVGTATAAERQFVWGLRYVDDLVLRDRDATGSGTLSERFYALQDANWNVTALADATGVVQERYAYDAYGVPSVLTGLFGARSTSLYAWEVRYAGYRWDAESGLYYVRHRQYHPSLGCWTHRDPDIRELNLFCYVRNNPIRYTDQAGLSNGVRTKEDCLNLWRGVTDDCDAEFQACEQLAAGSENALWECFAAYFRCYEFASQVRKDCCEELGLTANCEPIPAKPDPDPVLDPIGGPLPLRLWKPDCPPVRIPDEVIVVGVLVVAGGIIIAAIPGGQGVGVGVALVGIAVIVGGGVPPAQAGPPPSDISDIVGPINSEGVPPGFGRAHKNLM